MRVLVTGGAGFIGSFVCERLLSLGYHVRVLDSLDAQVHRDGQPEYLPPDVEFRLGDIRDRQACIDALAGVDAVVHAASAVGVAQSMYRIQHYMDVNVSGTATLLQCIVELPVPLQKLVVLTSMTGYGEGLYRRPSDGRLLRVPTRSPADIRDHGWEPVCRDTNERLQPVPTPETSDLQCRNVYALSKRYQEELSLALGDAYGIPVVCLRLFNVYGPRQSLSNPYTGVMAIFLSRLLADEAPIVYEDGGQTRDFVSVHDVVSAVMAALTSSRADGQVVNVGSGVPRTIAGIARTLAGLTGRESVQPRVAERYRLGDVRHCLADITRARELLGFEPRSDWTRELATLVAWARSAPSQDRSELAERELAARGLLADRVAVR